MWRDIELTVYDERYLGNAATPVTATVRYDISDDRAILERGMLSAVNQHATPTLANQYYSMSSSFIELTKPTCTAVKNTSGGHSMAPAVLSHRRSY